MPPIFFYGYDAAESSATELFALDNDVFTLS